MMASARSYIHHITKLTFAASDGWQEVYLAVFSYLLQHAQGGYLAVYGDGYVGLDPSVVYQAIFHTWEFAFQVVYYLADGGSGYLDYGFATGQVLH